MRVSLASGQGPLRSGPGRTCEGQWRRGKAAERDTAAGLKVASLKFSPVADGCVWINLFVLVCGGFVLLTSIRLRLFCCPVIVLGSFEKWISIAAIAQDPACLQSLPVRRAFVRPRVPRGEWARFERPALIPPGISLA